MPLYYYEFCCLCKVTARVNITVALGRVFLLEANKLKYKQFHEIK